MSRLLDAAVQYAEHGWAVFPLTPGTKYPLSESQGWKDATDDPEQVRQVWEQHPDANIGLATGPSGMAVLDVDAYKAPSGQVMEQLRRLGDVPDTLAARSPRGGLHLFYRGKCPSSTSNLSSHVDTRGEGGHVVLPPSTTSDGSYEWVRRADVAPLPQWMVDKLNAPDPEPEPETDDADEAGTAYGRAVLEGEVARVLNSEANKNRNTNLFKAAVRVFEVTKAGELGRGHAEKMLGRAAKATGLSRQEIKRTLASAWQRAEARGPEPVEREDRDDALWTPQFLTPGDLENLPPPQWLVPNVLPEGFSVLYGEPAAGKTFVALDLALSLAAHGQLVVYCAGEGASGLGVRYRAWVGAQPQHDPSKHFKILALGAFPRLLDPSSVHNLRRHLEWLDTPPALLVIDTWARTLAGGNENTAESAGAAVETLTQIQADFGSSILVLHHPKKGNGDGGAQVERGSGALRGAADCMWRCASYSDTETRRLYNDKVKEWEPLPPLRFRLNPSRGSCVVSPSVVDLMDS